MSSAGQPTVRLGPTRPQWEYHVLAMDVDSTFFGPNVDVDALGAALNRLGQDGWELVGTVDINRHQGITKELVLLFKRLRV
jgi:hypothetical protein